MNVLPLLGSLGSIALVAGIGGEHRARALLAAGLVLVATLGFVVVQVDRHRRLRSRRDTRSREGYRRHLGTVRSAARVAAAAQRRILAERHPDPEALPARVAAGPTWPVGTGQGSALEVRLGRSPGVLEPPLLPPEGGEEDPDPVSAEALRRLLAVHSRIPHLPATLDLGRFARVEVCGQEEPARALARALVCSAAAGHGPQRLAVAVLCRPSALRHWEWVKWLPHARSDRVGDLVGPARLVSTDPARLDALLPVRPRHGRPHPLPDPHLLLVLDGVGAGDLPGAGEQAATVLDLPETWAALTDPATLRLELTGRRSTTGDEVVLAVRPGEQPGVALADRCDPATAEALARRLAPLPGPGPVAGGPAGSPDLAGLLAEPGIAPGGRPGRPPVRWEERCGRDRLRVPIGVSPDGSPAHLDLKEAAEGGIGPHGLVVGATGSGKSELLRTLVLGLALGHPPDRLAMVLVDFKGGATFADLAGLPHVSALITNLAAELALVERMEDVLAGELLRRQEVLRRSGHGSAREHERARSAGADLDPLPSLLVVVDEFSELLAARPDFIETFVTIGRLGRSLGLHLLLASQRLEEGRLRGLDSHLSYRIALRTFSAGESRAVLGVPDAASLPPAPGEGYLRPDPSTLVRFRAARVSGSTPQATRAGADAVASPVGILPFSVAPVVGPADQAAAAAGPAGPGATGRERPAGSPSVLQAAVREMAARQPAGRARGVRRLWLPPLDASETLDALMPDLGTDPRLGLTSAGWRARGPLVVPLGVLDMPREQRRETCVADLRGADGHLAVVGGPRSGTSTLLRVAISALALTSTPLETQVLVVDLGGGGCARLAGLPHVAGVATRSEPEVVRRVVAEAAEVLRRRERLFREAGIASMEAYRERRRRGAAGDGWGDVFVVVDGWAAVHDQFGEVARDLQRLATTGLTYGVHLLVAATRWSDLRAGVRDVFGTRLELRLGDPADSQVDRRLAALVPRDRPGRGLSASGHHFLAAIPRLASELDRESREPLPGPADGADPLVGRCAAAWPGPPGPRLRLLPPQVGLAEVRRQAAGRVGAGSLLLGLEERELAPLTLDPDRDPHLLVLGEGGSGKTAALRAYAHEVVRTRSPERARLVLVDYRRSLLGDLPHDHVLEHLTSSTVAGPALADLAAHLEGRLPSTGVTPRQLRDRSWWEGPEVFVLVDDYDLVAGGRDSPVAALEHLLARATDVGLHLAVARRSGGASRSLHEPVLRTLRDLASPGLLLAGSPEEGPLLGPLRPEPAPPGRARLLTRDRGVEVGQLAWCDPRPPEPPVGQ